MRYTVKTYLCTNFSGLMNDLETDNLNEAQDFVWENVQKGYNCELTDTETGETNVAYADDFSDETVDVEMKIRNNTFYADLLMEQQEQM